MLLLLLSLTVLMIFLLSLSLAILHWSSQRLDTIEKTILQIQRNLNSFDQPESLSVAGVAPGSSWVQSEQEIAAFQAKMQAESQQRLGMAGSMKSKTTSTRKMALPTAASP